ncbi:D-ala D-ala ligase C-terminus-domain-containing protein [Pseudoneurospora amorphoporcata]|uniref:D-ala D-ala ligase C-terminus-domain-containing protein n=1 Tax=Pseudoneurospora amorphoporcata TaxID=241081 RepID=A0AAN6P026_9PEZI|nr:D-ala D-ala ligase C-terminus-domain-containing protein [Pseudoneurospora amorphoporcata]
MADTSKKNIAVVVGGYSGEYDVSISTGAIYANVDRSKYNLYKIVIPRDPKAGWYHLTDDDAQIPVDRNDFSVTLPSNGNPKIQFDLAYISIHGNPGENGVLQGYLDMLGLPYTSCGFYTSSLTANKGHCNPVVRSFGIVEVAKSRLLHRTQASAFDADALLREFELPVFVKPASGGSSVATTKVKSREQVAQAVEDAMREDGNRQVLVEEFIEGREFDCGVIRDAEGKLHVFPITEVIPHGDSEYFDYNAKYNGSSSKVTPAEVETEVSERIKDVSAQLYDLLDCRGVVRFDYRYNPKQKQLYFLEINTIPGQTLESMVPQQARAAGISTADLYHMVIEGALAGASR